MLTSLSLLRAPELAEAVAVAAAAVGRLEPDVQVQSWLTAAIPVEKASAAVG